MFTGEEVQDPPFLPPGILLLTPTTAAAPYTSPENVYHVGH